MGFGQQNDLKSAIFEGFRGILRWALLVKGGAYRTPIAASRSSPRRVRVDGGVTSVPYTFSLSTEPAAHTGDGYGDHRSSARFPLMRAREETPESRGMPCLF